MNPEFLQRVLTSSDDNERLVYADWLEENGELERANLIRRQCEIARLPRWDRRAIEARWEVDALLARHGARFRDELPKLDGVTWTEFERGFCSTVRVDSPATLYRHADAIAAAAPVHRVELGRLDESHGEHPVGAVPWLRTLRLTDHGDGHNVSPTGSLLSTVRAIEVTDIGEYQDLAFLNSRADDVPLESLIVEGGHTAVGLGVARQLAGAPWSNALTRLELGTSFVDYDSGYFDDPTLRVEGARALAEGGLVNLHVLDIDRQRVGTDGLRHLVNAMPHLRELSAHGVEAQSLEFFSQAEGDPIVSLDLSHNAIGDAGARAIAKAPRLAALESLNLDTCEIGAKGIDAIARASFWQTLRYLQLSRNPLGADGAVALFGGDAPPHLGVLRVSDCDIESDIASVLAGATWLGELLVLDLSRNDFEAGGVGFVRGLAFGRLRELSIARIQLDAEHAGDVAPVVPQLVHFDIGDNHLDDGAFGVLFGAPAPELQTLRLAWCRLINPALDKLVAPRLRSLSLAGNSLVSDAIEALAASSVMDALETLDLSKTKLDAATVVEIAPRLARLRTLNLRGNAYDKDALVALARCDALRGIASIKLDGQPWDFDQPSRELLAQRFGQHWYYHDSDDDGDGGDAYDDE
jgi:uncharacterized protein (TIGR02996 family)